jgi:hypothetical protein
MNQTAATELERTNRRKLVWGIVCLVGPTALIIIALTAYAVGNFVFGTMATPDTGECVVNSVNSCASDAQLFESSNRGNTIMNVILFLVGTVSIITWLPGIVVGIILIATRKSAPHANHQS